jgi:hypothetical protein
MPASVTDLHQHLAKYQAHHKALRAHHKHVAHGVAAERQAQAAAAAGPQGSPLSGPAGNEGPRPVPGVSRG